MSQPAAILRLVETLEALCVELRRDASTMAPVPDDLLTLQQAAHEFAKSVDTVRRWCVDERMGIQPGGRNTPWLISRADIQRVKRIAPVGQTAYAKYPTVPK